MKVSNYDRVENTVPYCTVTLVMCLVCIAGGLKTNIPAQMAAAGPPLGTQLGQLGVNIANFVKDFNLRTSIYRWQWFKSESFFVGPKLILMNNAKTALLF